MNVPELELELSAGTLGGIVTTVEGLIVKICEGMFSTLIYSCRLGLWHQN